MFRKRLLLPTAASFTASTRQLHSMRRIARVLLVLLARWRQQLPAVPSPGLRMWPPPPETSISLATSQALLSIFCAGMAPPGAASGPLPSPAIQVVVLTLHMKRPPVMQLSFTQPPRQDSLPTGLGTALHGQLPPTLRLQDPPMFSIQSNWLRTLP